MRAKQLNPTQNSFPFCDTLPDELLMPFKNDLRSMELIFQRFAVKQSLFLESIFNNSKKLKSKKRSVQVILKQKNDVYTFEEIFKSHFTEAKMSLIDFLGQQMLNLEEKISRFLKIKKEELNQLVTNDVGYDHKDNRYGRYDGFEVKKYKEDLVEEMRNYFNGVENERINPKTKKKQIAVEKSELDEPEGSFGDSLKSDRGHYRAKNGKVEGRRDIKTDRNRYLSPGRNNFKSKRHSEYNTDGRIDDRRASNQEEFFVEKDIIIKEPSSRQRASTMFEASDYSNRLGDSGMEFSRGVKEDMTVSGFYENKEPRYSAGRVREVKPVRGKIYSKSKVNLGRLGPEQQEAAQHLRSPEKSRRAQYSSNQAIPRIALSPRINNRTSKFEIERKKNSENDSNLYNDSCRWSSHAPFRG